MQVVVSLTIITKLCTKLTDFFPTDHIGVRDGKTKNKKEEKQIISILMFLYKTRTPRRSISQLHLMK